MKFELGKPFLFLIAVILFVSLACSLPTAIAESGESPPANEPAQPPPAPTSAPLEAAPPTAQPPTAVPLSPEPALQPYFREEFDDDTFADNWGYFYFGDSENDFSVNAENGRMNFEITGTDTYVYQLYTTQSYDNVRLETEVNNRGFNNNNVSLICRYTDDEGWYEFNIANNGLYWIYVYDEIGGTGYQQIANGGSNKIRTGKGTNQYAVVCNDKRLTLYINGNEVTTVEDHKYVLRQGMVGVSVSSFDVVPINVEFEWFDISQP